MSAALSMFEFDGASIRVSVSDDGQPMFVAKDVTEYLGAAWKGSATINHVPDKWKGVTSVVTPSGVTEVVALTEPGLYFYLNRSDKPKALPFQEWVSGEVLPSIRKTGSYAKSEPEQPLKLATACAHQALVLAGVRPTLASAAMLSVIEGHTGVAMEPARLMLPADTKPLASLTAKPIGAQLGLSAVAVNKLLEEKGLQTRNPRKEWEPTEEGKRLGGEMVAFDKNGHQGLQLRWPPSIVEVLK